MKRRRRTKQGGSQTTGRTSQRNCARRIKTRVGRSSSPRPSRARMARRRRSIWRFRSSAIKTTSRLIVASASFANGARQTPLPMKAVAYVKLDKTNTASAVWADTAYRSKANEEFMEKNGFVGHVHRKKPKGHSMPEAL